jgi:hypothetical protein
MREKEKNKEGRPKHLKKCCPFCPAAEKAGCDLSPL